MIASPGSKHRSHVLDRLLGDLARRHHHPDRARRAQLRRQVRQRGGALGTLPGQFGDRVGVDVVGDDAMAVAHQPPRHVGAHAAETRPFPAPWPNPIASGAAAACQPPGQRVACPAHEAVRGQARRRQGGRADDFRHHRRPGEENDLPGALPARGEAASSTARSSASRSTNGRSSSCASTPAKRSPQRSKTPTRTSSPASPSGSPTSRATTPTPPPSSRSARRSATPSGRSSTSRSPPRCSPPWSTGSARPASPRTPTS